MEDKLQECLNMVTNKADLSKLRKSAAYDLLDKPWVGLLEFVLSKDAQLETSGDKKSSQRPRGPRGRGRSGNRNPFVALLEPTSALITSDAPPGYRLTALLVQRSLSSNRWKPEWDNDIEKLRDTCKSGIHPVWSEMAQKSHIISELMSYPTKKPKARQGNIKSWVEGAKIDPNNNEAVIGWLNAPNPFNLNSEVEQAIQRIAKDIMKNRASEKHLLALEKLEGNPSLIRAIIHTNISKEAAIPELEKIVAEDNDVQSVAQNILEITQLRNGNTSYWKACYSVKGDDPLSVAMRNQSWKNIPDNASLSVLELQEGIEAQEGPIDPALEWALFVALIGDKLFKEADELVSGISVIDKSRLPHILKFLSNYNSPKLVERLTEEIHKFNHEEIIEIMNSDVRNTLRVSAALELQKEGGDPWVEHQNLALDIVGQAGNASQIGTILRKIDNSAEKHPYLTLLVYHLLDASAKEDLREWATSSRVISITTLAKGSVNDPNTASNNLIKILEGAPSEIAPIHACLDPSGIKAFNQCRRALMDEGDGLVAKNLLDELENSVKNSGMKPIEENLFIAVITDLRFNRVLNLLENGKKEDVAVAETSLNTLIGKTPRMRIMGEARQAILEYGLSIPALSDWHRENIPSSPWHRLILAFIDVRDDKQLSAARGLRDSSRIDIFSYEERVRLARRALILFAHAGEWRLAVEMLENPHQSALKSALTNQFQLYLHVCNEQSKGRSGPALEHILRSIKREEEYDYENPEGETEKRTRTTYPSDELDSMFNYPNIHGLPKEPWQGRIRAALNGLTDNRRSPMSLLQSRFRNILTDKGTVSEIEAIAKEAAELDPITGLMMFERAINSGQYLNEKKPLLRSQKAVYSLHQEQIPIKSRMKFRHLQLKPMVLIDTNLLIDAIKEEIHRELGNETGSITYQGGSTFHRKLYSKATKKEIECYIPSIVISELIARTKSPQKLRELFTQDLIEDDNWEKAISNQVVSEKRAKVLRNYNTWSPGDVEQLSTEASAYNKCVEEFLVSQSPMYQRITDYKSSMNKNTSKNRTSIQRQKIYPESGDREIMRVGRALSNQSIWGIGSILVATRDSDFTVGSKMLEDKLGFGVIRKLDDLNQRLR
ncbi:MAG: hypothetical protein QF440_04310 [Candidatus Thalassarchaeaceae archaeon]|nr:hypothetical protein [Candidatus Thalassarchaeaceae archaeon]